MPAMAFDIQDAHSISELYNALASPSVAAADLARVKDRRVRRAVEALLDPGAGGPSGMKSRLYRYQAVRCLTFHF